MLGDTILKAPAIPPPVPLLVVEWGSRSRARQANVAAARAARVPPDSGPSGDSFMLVSPGPGPVALGYVDAASLATWDAAATTPLAINRKGNELQVSAPFVPPTNPANLRLDFDLKVTAGGQTASVLTFRQLFETDDKGLLNATKCAIESLTFSASPTTVTGSTGTRRIFSGQHPLITFTQLKISVNAEFVDLTQLWWAIRHDKVGWYLNPALGGRPTHLRVLGWTTGGYPMIWFACIPDAAESAITPPPTPPDQPAPPPVVGADLAFMRPQAGFNTFAYSTSEKGLADANHDETTMWILARYLLTPIRSTVFPGVKTAGTVPTVTITLSDGKTKMALSVDHLADQLQPTGATPVTDPPDPMTIAKGLPYAFRPVGMEAAFNRSGGRRVMFLPLGVDTNSAYEGCVLSGLRLSVRNALFTLWNQNAVDRSGTSIPNLDNRELWIGAHSGANISMFDCARRNAADVARIICCDAINRKTLANGIAIFTAVNGTRKGAGKTLELFVIVSPNLTQDGSPGLTSPWQGMDDNLDKALRATGAVVTELPDFPERVTFWTPSPVSTPTTFVQYVLANWSATLIAGSAATPANWRFLFFHELAVYGGHLVLPPVGPAFSTFFENALGAPNPRP